MLNRQQNIMPYAYEMVNDLPTSSGIDNANVPSLAPSMMTPMNNKESFMPTQRNMQGSYAAGGIAGRYNVDPGYNRGPNMDEFQHFRPQQRFAEGGMANGPVGIEALLQQMSPEEIQNLIGQHQQGQQQPHTEGNLPNWGQNNGYITPHYARGGLFKKLEKKIIRPVLKPLKPLKGVAPLIGGIGGAMLGGPFGAALGAGLGGKLQGGKHANRNALLYGAGAYGLSTLLAPMMAGGAGAVGPGMTGKQALFGSGTMFPTGAGGVGAGIGAGGAGAGSGLAGLLGKMSMSDVMKLGKEALPFIGIGATLLGKHKVPKEPSLAEHINGSPKWGPQHMGRKIKPMERIQNILGPDEEGKYFEDVNPETQYGAEGGYLEGHSSGQEDDIDAKLSPGEFILSADVVSRLGDGNNAHGAKKLDAFMRNVRMSTNSKSGKLSPKSRGIESYLRRAS